MSCLDHQAPKPIHEAYKKACLHESTSSKQKVSNHRGMFGDRAWSCRPSSERHRGQLERYRKAGRLELETRLGVYLVWLPVRQRNIGH